MPVFKVPIPDTERTVTRPIVTEIITQVQNLLGMPPCQIFYPSDRQKIANPNATLDTKNRDIRFSNERANFVEVDETMDASAMSESLMNGKEYHPIFYDQKLGLNVAPIYAKHQVKIQIKYQSPSESEATRWMQDMRIKITELRETLLHTVRLSYGIHESIYDLIKTIYTLREKQAGYGESFTEYLSKITTPRMTTVTDTAGKNSAFVVTERLAEVLGRFDFDGLPEKPTRDTSKNTWTISFGYLFEYNKPIGLTAFYPMMVHNQPLPLELVEFMGEDHYFQTKPTKLSRTQSALAMVRADLEMARIRNLEPIIHIPKFDDFTPSTYLAATAGFLLAQIQLDPSDTKDILDLTQLGEVKIDDDIIDFILKSEWKYMTLPYQSIIQVSLYQDGYLQGQENLTMSKDGKLKAKTPLDIRKRYHVRLSLVVDLDLLPPDAIARLIDNGKSLVKIIEAINEAIRDMPEFVDKIRDSEYSMCDFNVLYLLIYGKLKQGTDQSYGWHNDSEIFKHVKCLTEDKIRKIRNQQKMYASVLFTGVVACPSHLVSDVINERF